MHRDFNSHCRQRVPPGTLIRIRKPFLAASALAGERRREALLTSLLDDADRDIVGVLLQHADEEQTGFLDTPALLTVGEQAPSEHSSTRLEQRRRLGPYELCRELGRGGMGRVWLAKKEGSSAYVVLKTLRPSVVERVGRVVRTRFSREALAGQKLHHHGICPVYDLGSAKGIDYIVMKYVRGMSLEKWLDHMRASSSCPPRHGSMGYIRRVLQVLERVAGAVHFAHEAGVIHRDLKPANIVLQSDDRPVVIDFGIAIDLQRGDPRLSTPGERIGTPSYMAPEQVLADEAPDRRSDIYALGVVLYELLTLSLPFEARPPHLFQDILAATPPSLREANPAVEPGLEAVCLRAMAGVKAQRYQTAAAFAEALRAIRLDRGEAA